ncbi:MAG: ABC transporter permease [Lentimicrobiaceae bacterium]|nr:ABC transporter permease [Lentimicrobiaceae bacterium]
MQKLLASTGKEFLVLIRDKAGLAILFLMPMIMVLVITLVQDFAFQSIKENQIKLLLLDNDRDSLGIFIANGLKNSEYFVVTEKLNGKTPSDDAVHKAVAAGDYQIGIIIPAHATQVIRSHARAKITRIFMSLKINTPLPIVDDTDSVRLTVLFDPVIKSSFKNSILSTLDKFTSKIEAKVALGEFAYILAKMFNRPITNLHFDDMSIVQLNPSYAADSKWSIIPNSVQHNVPAWTMFAMFFLVIPLAGCIIKERDEGSLFRLMTMPGSYFKIFSGKIIVYLVVCIIQFLLMIAVGVFFLPILGLPQLVLGSNFAAMALIVLSSALAALGYGMATGVFFKTHQQAASFGSISVIIMAALGGVWVPVHFMPQVMQQVATYSPLNWGLNGFYDIFLRNTGVSGILPDAFKLLAFFAITSGIAYVVFLWKRR